VVKYLAVSKKEFAMVTAYAPARRTVTTALAAIALLALLAWQAPVQAPSAGDALRRRQQRALELEVERDSLLQALAVERPAPGSSPLQLAARLRKGPGPSFRRAMRGPGDYARLQSWRSASAPAPAT
jgi:hypothetical protein